MGVEDLWVLRVDGAVRRPLALTLAELAAMPQRERSPREGHRASDRHWRGVPLAELLLRAGASGQARWLRAASGNRAAHLWLAHALAGDALVALTQAGMPLPEAEGPACLVCSGETGAVCVRCLTHLDIGEVDCDASAAVPVRSAPQSDTGGTAVDPDAAWRASGLIIRFPRLPH